MPQLPVWAAGRRREGKRNPGTVELSRNSQTKIDFCFPTRSRRAACGTPSPERIRCQRRPLQYDLCTLLDLSPHFGGKERIIRWPCFRDSPVKVWSPASKDLSSGPNHVSCCRHLSYPALSALSFCFLISCSHGAPSEGLPGMAFPTRCGVGSWGGTHPVKSISTQRSYLQGEGCFTMDYPNTSSHNQP